MKWEYRVEVVIFGKDGERHLDTIGRDGWELVTVAAQRLEGSVYFHGFFKRPKAK